MSFGSLSAALDPVQIGRYWFVRQPEGDRLRTVLYARVSSADQRADLDRQKLRLLEYAQHHRIQVDEVIVDVGSGLNASRHELLGVLSKPGPGIVLVEHRDRLARFCFELVDTVLRARGDGVLVVEDLCPGVSFSLRIPRMAPSTATAIVTASAGIPFSIRIASSAPSCTTSQAEPIVVARLFSAVADGCIPPSSCNNPSQSFTGIRESESDPCRAARGDQNSPIKPNRASARQPETPIRSCGAAPILAPLMAHPAEGTHQLPRRLPGAVIHRAIQNQTVLALVQFLDYRAQQGTACPVQRSRNGSLIRCRTVLTCRIRQLQLQQFGAKRLQRCIRTCDQLRARGSGLGGRKRQ